MNFHPRRWPSLAAGLFLVVYSDWAMAQTIHVSPSGNAGNPGTEAKPLASLSEAISLVRSRQPKHIVLHQGNYALRDGITLTKNENRLILEAAPGEEVRLSGFKTLPSAAWKRAQEPRLLDPQAKEAALECDLTLAGCPDVPSLSRRGFDANELRQTPAPWLFVDGKPMTLARWPNEGTVRLKSVKEPGPSRYDSLGRGDDAFKTWLNKGGTFVLNTDRAKRWTEATEIWLQGILGENWAWTANRVSAFVPATSTFTLAHGEAGGVQKLPHARDGVFFENLPEEIDQPGEYWLDHSGKRLVLWPPKTPAEGSASSDLVAQLTWASRPLMTLQGASHVSLRGLVFEGGRSSALIIAGGSSHTIERCEFRHCGEDGIVAETTQLRLINCEFHHLGGRGLRLTGGDYETLTASGNVVENCRFHDLSQWDKAYHAAIDLEGVGHRISHCDMSHLPHMAMQLSGNDHIIEGCEFHHVCLEIGDMCAIALNTGSHPEWRGIVIRENFFHHIGITGSEADGPWPSRGAIYLDNATSGITISKNIFSNVGVQPADWTIMIHGGRHNLVEANTFINCPRPVHVAFWFAGYGKGELANHQAQWKAVFQSPAGKAAKIKYPELLRFDFEDPVLPETNVMRDNKLYNPTVAPVEPSGLSVEFGPRAKVQAFANEVKTGAEAVPPPLKAQSYGVSE